MVKSELGRQKAKAGRGQKGGGLQKQRFSKWVNREVPDLQNRVARP